MKKNCKTIIKAISLLLIILFFVPAFAVSCSGEKVNVSAAGAMGGYSSDYGEVSSPQPALILLLLIPIAIAVVMFVKQLLNEEKKQSLIVLILACVDFIGWLLFKSKVSEFCQQNHANYTSKIGFILSAFGTIVIALIAAGLYFEFIKDDGIQGVNLSQLNNLGFGKEWTCPACGTVQPADSKFCSKCGSIRPATSKNCKYCGKENPVDNKFCIGCGKSFDDTTSNETPETEVNEGEDVSDIVENTSQSSTEE